MTIVGCRIDGRLIHGQVAAPSTPSESGEIEDDEF